ncbi:hypothetical protein [Pandoraea apista]|uniref:Lipoprotein n=1 Tax=Pandoraea apista TaxID=93218 RepID=A0A5E5P4G5_9BURK|nr:hypothetical protein [Pandoraea apista]OXS89551.1 hypothetical protein B7H01_19875 [Pandoraea apista]VVG70699.1 hypothetical protein PAP18089_01663 [Pandoraea apista]
MIRELMISLSICALAAGCSNGEQPRVAEVTLSQFDSIREGMTYADVVKLLGSSGKQASSQDVNGTIVSTYSWPVSSGDSILVMFAKDLVIKKIPGLNMQPPLPASQPS